MVFVVRRVPFERPRETKPLHRQRLVEAPPGWTPPRRVVALQ